MFAARTFSAKDFVETRKGVCRVLAPLTHTLAETTAQWARAIAPVVESVAAMLAANSASRIERLPTPLTQANRSAGRDAVRRKPKRSTSGAAQTGRDLRDLWRTAAERRAAVLRRLPARRTSATRNELRGGRRGGACEDARRRSRAVGQRRRRGASSARPTPGDAERKSSGIEHTTSRTRTCSRARYCRCLRACRYRR